jgi:hypothetical protein
MQCDLRSLGNRRLMPKKIQRSFGRLMTSIFSKKALGAQKGLLMKYKELQKTERTEEVENSQRAES